MRNAGSPPDPGKLNIWCSLITVTYNSSEALKKFWSKAQNLPHGVEWIVVDNGSTDGCADLARRLGATVVIERKGNFGFSSSNNVGLETARGSFIGFVNPDVEVNLNDLPKLARVAQDTSAIVSPQLLNPDGSRQPNGRGFPFLIDKIRNRLGAYATDENRYLLFSGDGQPRKVCWLMGASVFGMRTNIEKFYAWDSGFFIYYEDSDFGLRAWAAGVPVFLLPEFTWVHGWARETKTARAKPWKRELGSMWKFYRRYPEFLLGAKAASRAHPRIHGEVFGMPSSPQRR
jgi:N-acetylglucosaminyl-diphospho-decaprenol L-rhamnosyltransferase